MLAPEQPDRIQIAFDDHRLVNNAGLLLPVTLAKRLSLPQLVDRHVDLGRALGRTNTGDKMTKLGGRRQLNPDHGLGSRQLASSLLMLFRLAPPIL